MDIEKALLELTLEEKAELCAGADFWHTKAVERLGVPSVMLTDGPHGLRKQNGKGDHMGLGESIEAICFPTASALASSFDADLLYSLGEVLGEECQAENIGMLLGPGLNMKRSPLCGRNFEYFSEDPYLTGKLGAAYIKGLQSKGVAACVKHFAVNNQETRRMNSTSNIDERTLHEIYLPAFETAVKEGKVRGVMNAYNAVNGTYCAENKELLTDILRNRWGFDGIVVTDWGAVRDRVEGLIAGLDLQMPYNGDANKKKIIQSIQDGSLSETVLNETVRNILTFADAYIREKNPSAVFDRTKDHYRSAEIAKECAVLMKNNGVLPLEKESKIAVIGEFAAEPRYQGAGSSHINAYHVTGALEVLGDTVAYAQGYYAKETQSNGELLNEAVSKAKSAQTAVIFAGLPDAFETEGKDRETLALPDNQNELIMAVTAVQPNTVIVFHGGAPVEMPWIDKASAVLCMYLGGEGVGKAAVDLLYGDANPSGKLAETWPLKLADNPSYLNFPGEDGVVEYREGVYIGYRYYDKKQMDVLLPFGFGMSYTSFEYSDIRIDKNTMDDIDTLMIMCKVKNTGNRSGKEAVQLYVRDIESMVGRPMRELKGFSKVSLLPGEEKDVTFILDKRAFAYYEPKIHDWYVESGMFAIEVGSSSRDIKLSANVEVHSTATLPYVFTADTSMGVAMRHPRGKALMEGTQPKEDDSRTASNRKAMGEGSDGMVQTMMEEMPLRSLASFGKMTQEQLDNLIDMLNS